MGIIVKNQKVNMPKGFTGNYADHVIRIGIKRALQNKKQRDNNLNKQANVSEILKQLLKNPKGKHDSDATQHESSQGTRLPGRSG
jgi:hypothetical protein